MCTSDTDFTGKRRKRESTCCRVRSSRSSCREKIVIPFNSRGSRNMCRAGVQVGFRVTVVLVGMSSLPPHYRRQLVPWTDFTEYLPYPLRCQ